jgi:hypothetical protein
VTEANNPADGLNPKQRRALIQLAFHDGRVEKVGDLKPSLDPLPRVALRKRGFLEEKKSGRGKAIELTDSGWRWVMEHLDSDLPEKEQVAGLLMEVLKRLSGFLRANQFDLNDVIRQRQVSRGGDIEQRDARNALLRAAEELGGANAPQIRLRDLRPKLAKYSRDEVDAAIRELQIERKFSVIPIDLPTDINEDDRKAAIEIAGNSLHAIIVRGR